MNTEPNYDYTLLFRGHDREKRLSPTQLRLAISAWAAWFERLSQESKCNGHPRPHRGKLVSGKKGRMVTDGPFAESKEAIGGYFNLQAGEKADAIAIAQQCPGLEYGCVSKVPRSRRRTRNAAPKKLGHGRDEKMVRAGNSTRGQRAMK